MTNQQKYAELLEEHMNLGAKIDRLAIERNELRDQMVTIAGSFPDSFYYRLDKQLLYRANKQHTIELRTFDK